MKEYDIKEENDNLIKTSSSDSIDYDKKSSSDLEEVDQDKLQVILKDIKAEYTSVAEILSPAEVELQDKDLFDLIKFTIKVEAVNTYNWVVYHKPDEIKKNFENISDEWNKNNIVMTGNFGEMFTVVGGWREEELQLHISEVENFYRNLFNNSSVYSTKSFQEFFNISSGSFNQSNEGSKPFEGYVYKKADPQCLRKAFSIVCYCIEYFAFAQYNLRWLIVKDDQIYYKDKSDSNNGKNVYFFDKDLTVEREGRDSINITNVSRSLILKFKTVFEREIWYLEIKKRADKMLKILANNKYKAYTNEKTKNKAHWFADGEKYFDDLAKKLSEARSTIFITDWWLSPEVFLVRPVPTTTYMAMAYQHQKKKETPPYHRLMDILYQCANRGVKICILIYAECRIALSLESIYTENSLTSLHPNIHVQRHPTNALDLLWSHHEKLVIIDQIIGYVGGIDLCWGRYDTNEHPISEPKDNGDNPSYLFPGIDYSNARIRDFSNLNEYLTESADREQEARMPWHDVHCRIIGPVVADIARHFVERWNFSKFGTEEAITDIKQNSSVSLDNSKNKKGELKVSTVKKKVENYLRDIINKKYGPNSNNNNVSNNNDIIGDKTEALIPDDDKDEKEELKKDENNINNKNNINNEDKKDNEDNKEEGFLDTKGMKLKGETKLRGKKRLILKKKKEQNNNDNNIDNTIKEEIKIEDKEDNLIIIPDETNENDKDNNDNKENLIDVEEVDYTKKIGYDEEQRLREEYMSNKIFVDDDHFYVKKPEDDNTNTKLRGKRRNPGVINDPNEINTASNLIETEEGNVLDNTKPKKPDAYNKLVGYIGEHSKKKKETGLLKRLFAKNEEEEIKLENNIVNVNFFMRGIKSKVQVLRSASEWSVGIKKTENSILQAYYLLIEKAKHYIYIENQFFVSRSFSEEERKKCPHSLATVVENLIAYKIKEKILDCYRKGKKFRVFVFIPLLPGFAGEPESCATLQIILKHTYAGICRNHGVSIIEQLEKEMGDKWKEYIGFYSLRGHGMVNGIPTTEIIYIHSKLMIVDDRKVILGSANINDRSMLGMRDSEYCVLIKEKKRLNSKMEGKDYKAANFAFSFRTHLFAEHLGLNPKDPILVDPLNDELLKLLQTRAENNTLIYRELWGCYPDDNYKSYKDIKPKKKFGSEEELRKFKELYENKKKNIIGHVVQFPLHFLEKESLLTSFFCKENMLPERNFT